ncbi:hypothetical protein IJ095_03265 [Candidatus Saccharibacteria bacterium]|nr:hypothetical protein [Candidatus Saccharibacteria bacterium]
MQDQQKSLTVRKGADAYHLGDYIGHYCNPSTASIRKSFYCSLACLALFLLSFVITPYLITEANASQAVDAAVSWAAVSVELDPDYAATQAGGSISDSDHGNILFGGTTGIHPSTTSGSNIGTEVVIKKTIAVTTEGQYFRVFLSTSGVDSNNQYTSDLQHTAANSGLTIPTIGGTWDSPVAFSDATWGYAVPGTSVPKSDGSAQSDFTQSSTFSSSTLGIELNALDHSAVYNRDKWAAVPVYGQSQEIWSASTNNSAGFGPSGDTNFTFDVYYGVMIDTDVLAGTYQNTLVYTALASSDALDAVSSNISRSQAYVANGATEVLSFDLSASTADVVTYDKVELYLVPHDIVESANYTITDDADDPIRVAVSAGTAISITVTSTNFSLSNTGAMITFTMPDLTPAGNLSDSADPDQHAGLYDFWVSIPEYGYNYLSKYTDGTNFVASAIYAGLQSKDAAGDYYVDTMQGITSDVCKNTNRWSNQVGDNARILDYSGATQLVEDIMTTAIDEETGEETTIVDTEATLAANTATGLGTFALTDTRDNNVYLVRRLSNGSCWMVENLRLDLSIVGTLTPADSDLAADWTPDASTVKNSYTGASAGQARMLVANGITYYNWYAAVAETVGATFTTATRSICPRGWMLPTRTALSGGTAGTVLPFSAQASGYYSNSSGYNGGSLAYLWSRQSYASTTAYAYRYTRGTANSSNYEKKSPTPVRCVAR